MKFLYSNASSIFNSDIVIIGLPDESKSNAKRKGASKGPDGIRMASNEYEYFERDGKVIRICPMAGDLDNKMIFDFGNINRDDLYRLVYDICSAGKIPIILGGDHSITTLTLKAINDSIGKVNLLYFDAHPDFVTSAQDYYGSVLSDSAKCINFDKSLLIGTRAAEPEEIKNALENELEIITPLDVLEKGVSSTAQRIISRCGTKSNVYLSLDLDCIDPGIAPGVSVPAAGGLSSLEVIFLVKKVCHDLNLVGLDIVELTPAFDLNNNTANIAARILMEAIASMKIKRDSAKP